MKNLTDETTPKALYSRAQGQRSVTLGYGDHVQPNPYAEGVVSHSPGSAKRPSREAPPWGTEPAMTAIPRRGLTNEVENVPVSTQP